jgi:tetratricopeptide (TPR) repeat protein
MQRRRRLAPCLGGALGVMIAALLLSPEALAVSPTAARGQAQIAIQSVEGDIGKISAASARARKQRVTPTQRIAAADMLFRNKDYERAIDELEKVVELHKQGKAPATAHADALYYLAESYFRSKQYLSARRHFDAIAERATQSPYDSYAGRALSRLVDVTLRTGNFESLDAIVAKLDKLPASDASGSLPYARGKAQYAKRDYDAARNALASVASSSAYAHQAQYLVGVILVKQATPSPPPPAEEGTAEPAAPAPAIAPEVPKARYAGAIEHFRKITRMPATTESQRHVVDLSWMAIGRLFYETDDYLDAAEAYSHVDRKSPEFSPMLFELAWVYVRLGDYQRAQRALEVLSITDPESLNLADGSLLRADLMLRSGQFEKALTLYRGVRGRFDPIREQVDTFLTEVTDPAIYYDRLVEDNLGAEQTGGPLSPLVVQWAREQAEDDRAFAVIDDVSQSRDLVRRSRRLITKLNAVLGSPAKAKAFPELQAALEATLALLNKTTMARRLLAEGMDAEAGNAGGELARVRSERRSLMKRLGWLPVTPADFSKRESSGERQWNKVSQELQQLTLQADKLQAVVNGLKRVIKDADQFGVTADPMSRQRFVAEIASNERDLEAHRKRIKELQDAVDLGRVQVGFGDQRYVEDDQVRRRFRQVFAREVELVAAGQDSGGARDYARSIQSVLQRADAVEDRLEREKARLERDSDGRASEIRKQVASEQANIDKFANDLDDLDQQARLLVGEVAMRNFGLVRDRLKGIVLRADVGIVQQAWEVREEQRMRVLNLQRERAREEQNLNDELREVLDDAGGDL